MKWRRLGRTTGPDNEAPPVGPIVLDLNGTPIPHAYQQYTTSFVATSAASFISFAFREDPAFLGLDDVSVTTGGGPNLIVNGGFESGILGEPAPIGWTYLNEFEATFFGVVADTSALGFDPHSGSYFYYDGAVQAYDVITQLISTSTGLTYTISFWLRDNSDLTTFQRLSDNGEPGADGNAVNFIVYAGDSQPTWGSLDSCIGSIFEPGNPGNATDTGAITTPRFPRSVAIVEAAAAVDSLDGHIPAVINISMLEATSAAATVNAGFAYAVAVGAETAAASSTQDATVVSGAVPVTWNSSDKSANILLSGGNLTVACSTNTDNAVRGTRAGATGKLYFEASYNTTLTGADTAVGIATAAAVLTSVGSSASNAALAYFDAGGAIWYNGSSAGKSLGGTQTGGDVVCVAVDMTNKKIWFRRNAGLWNNTAGNDPATNTGGISISSLFTANAAYPIATVNSSTPLVATNFGASSFAQAIPSGFLSWNAGT
jgi:hypothetical protein